MKTPRTSSPPPSGLHPPSGLRALAPRAPTPEVVRRPDASRPWVPPTAVDRLLKAQAAANAPNLRVQAAALQRVQQTRGNRAVQNLIRRPIPPGEEPGPAVPESAAVPEEISIDRREDGVEVDETGGDGSHRGASASVVPAVPGRPTRRGPAGPETPLAPPTESQERERSVEGADDHPASPPAEPLDEPFHVEAPEPLSVSPAGSPYPAPLELPADALRFPTSADKSERSAVERNHAAVLAARQAYARAARLSKDLHDGMVAESTAALERVRQFNSAAVQRGMGAFRDAWNNLDRWAEEKRRQLDAGLEAARLAIEGGCRDAEATIASTAAGAHGHLRAAFRGADAQIDRMVTAVAEPFEETIRDAKDRVGTSGERAAKAVANYVAGHLVDFPMTGTAVLRARNEWIRKQAPKAINDEAALLRRAVTETVATYTEVGSATSTEVKAGARPPLEQRKHAISTEGHAAVSRAMRQALHQIQEQRREAQKAVTDTHASAVAQLAGQRRAGRVRLEGMGRSFLLGLRAEAEAANRGIQNGTRSSLTLYGRTVTNLADGMTRTAEQGPDALQRLAAGAASDIERTLTVARRQQSDRIEANEHAVRASLERREATVTAEREAALDAARMTLATAADAAQGGMNDAVSRYSAAFSQAASAIAATTEAWTKPFTAVFPHYVRDAIGRNKVSHDRWAGQIATGRDQFVRNADRHVPAKQFFAAPLEGIGQTRRAALNKRVQTLKDELFAWLNIKEANVTGALHGLSAVEGDAIVELFGPGNLRTVLREKLNDNDYNASIAYLAGNRESGARWELHESTHWYNDEEDRIEKVLRDLTPDERAHLTDTPLGASAVEEVKDALGGTDLKVFDALLAGRDARADAFRMRDRIQESRRAADIDTFNAVLSEYSRATTDATGREISAAERRLAVQREFAAIQDNVAADQPAAEISPQEAQDRLLKFALEDIEIHETPPDGGPAVVRTLRVEGAQRDLAEALVRHGEDSVDARAARLGVEVQRPGRPNLVNLDTALVDPRLNPRDPRYSAQDREDALRERERVFGRFVEKYAPRDPAQGGIAAQQRTEQVIRDAFGEEHLEADLASRWVRETHPSPQTAALAIRVATSGVGTNEDLVFRTLEHMDREEIVAMRAAYREQTRDTSYPNGRDLNADLGVFGHRGDWFTEFSGDEALRLETKLLGVPRNDQERAEVAFLESQQQQEETGWFGSWLASGTVAEADLHATYQGLQDATGGHATFDASGTPRWTGGLFDEQGNYKGTNRAALENAIQLTQLAAQSYAARIDSYATAATMAIAIVGAIAAAAVTVATGGAASPLLLAAIAGITGLAGMTAHAAISGGRYGWEQAAVDLGMTAVQMLTAGVGQSLGLASRGGATAVRQAVQAGLVTKAGQITGSALADMLLIGGATGGLNALGQTALAEETWSKGADFALDQLLEGLLRGVVSGTATVAVTQAFEAIPAGKAVSGLPRPTIGSRMNDSSNMILRGGLKAASGGIGGFTGRSAELGIESASGRYRGDAGDLFVESLEAAAQATGQGFGEGMAEARTHAYVMARQQARLQQAEGRGSAPGAGEPAGEERPAGAIRRLTDEPAERREFQAARPSLPGEPETPDVLQMAGKTSEPPEPPAPTRAPTIPDEPAAPASAARPPADETSFAAFDALTKDVSASPFGERLEAAKSWVPEPLREDLSRTRQQVDSAAHAEAQREPPPGEIPGAEIQHQTKVRDVTVNLPPGVPPLHPDVINENLLWLQTDANLPATRGLVDPTGRPTRYVVGDVPFIKRMGGIGFPGEQLDLFLPNLRTRGWPARWGRRYTTEHRMMDNYVIRGVAAQIVESRRRSGLAPLDPRILVIAAGEIARWRYDGTPGTTRTGFVVELGRWGQQPLAPEILSPPMMRRPAAVGGVPPTVAPPIPRQLELPFGGEQLQLPRVAPEPTGAGARSRVAEPQAIPAGPPKMSSEQAAAGIAGTPFAGDAAERLGLPPARPTHVSDAIDALVGRGGPFAEQARVPDPRNNPWHVQLDAKNDQRVVVRIEMEESLPRPGGEAPRGASVAETAAPVPGEMPVAVWKRVGPSEYLVQVSKGAPAGAVERALAHELAEIRAVHAQQGTVPATEDRLVPGAKAGKLSPHDEGRLAEAGVLSRRFNEAPADSPERARILDETQRLAARLGLTGESEGAAGRRALVAAALGDSAATRLLADAILTAGDNPFLQRLTGDVSDDLRVLVRRLEHVQRIGEPERAQAALRAHVVEQARRLIEPERLVTRARKGAGGGASQTRVGEFKKSLQNPSLEFLVDEAIALARQHPESAARLAVPLDPSELDPHTGAAVRALFGDHERFEDWPTFKTKYLDANPSLAGDDPRVLRRMFEQWAAGSFVDASTGRARSLLSTIERPSPGYEHTFRIEPERVEALRLKGDAVLEIGKGDDRRKVLVDDAVMERNERLSLAGRKRFELETVTDPIRRVRLSIEIESLMQGVRDLSEALGVAAGRAYAAQHHPDGDVREFGGAGVPDLLVKLPDGRIVVIECKGGESSLGSRISKDGLYRVEQGTREYLESLAAEMRRSTKVAIREWGKQLLQQVYGGAELEYVLVAQKLGDGGRPLAPDVARFDTAWKNPRGGEPAE